MTTAVPALADAHVLVVGLGVTGTAVVEALTGRARAITTLDAGGGADFADDSAVDLADIDVIVASPGWQPRSDIFVRADLLEIPIWSEVELSWRLRVAGTRTGKPAAWLAVTGTNGKTTTALMTGAILDAAGVPHAVVGNVGTPLITAALDPALEVLVVELSSFQLHFTHSLQAHAAAVLNLAEDHLDWHGSMAAYAAAKAKIFAGVTGALVYPVGDEAITAMVREADVTDGARAIGFTLGAPGPGEIGLVESIIVDRAFHADPADPLRHRSSEEIGTLDDLGHLGGADGSIPSHVIRNALAAAALARSVGVPAGDVSEGLSSFHPGHHRIETIAAIGGVRYIDDSKATNPHAARAALLAQVDGSAVWIAGGLTKGVSFDDLVIEVGRKLRAAVVIGRERGQIVEALRRHAPHIPTLEADDSDTDMVMSSAVELAAGVARPGDVVLLAPACASMDQFRSYAHRGQAFASAVSRLAEATGAR
ncbi:UDP-N-acetylmuramoyl-L-alanine--D-glutamate ligase [Rarobacter faecitabidus]|uniref:UDP-N-acetylmuramoylalanine--D-glutamate ligase n=1 Tax=Rarobacter faecitabidus TaxID=13243 RepID=A0A542ZWE0_RARFA|nr:UDP-N-acetylmuramoyl-L-alanine--D-glutamate ligase [Rarobacter faecitabidus]TQL64619.1 UDP-N-acetylmuramoylalanine--D-glutamate ligase [Rarobacter faecitabidus]